MDLGGGLDLGRPRFGGASGGRRQYCGDSQHHGIAILPGLANGLVFASLLLPVLGNLVEETDGTITEAPLQNLAILVTQLLSFLAASLSNFWQWVQPLNSLTWLVIITLVLVLTALTLKRGAKAKS